MNKKVLKYAYRIARECKKKKPLDMVEAKRQCALNDIQEALRPKE